MTRALVLGKFLPVTKGHKALIEFAAIRADYVHVLMDYASDEPYVNERFWALRCIAERLGDVWIDKIPFEAQHESESPTYWQDWAKILEPFDGYDYVIGSEDYCFGIADMIGAQYIPYDPERALYPITATEVRHKPYANFKHISAHFQPCLRKTVTFFGAESTGKTTLSKTLTDVYDARWVHEYARPYLETVGTDITVESMTNIYFGQKAIEQQARTDRDKFLIVRDTDLYSTIGYWEQPHWADVLGPVPRDMVRMAHKADLYLILKSNIPFEKDPLRYGGDRRESSDEYWISVAEKYSLNYRVIDASLKINRFCQAYDFINEELTKTSNKLNYTRRHNG